MNDRLNFGVQIFLYIVCAVWTGLIIPIDEIFFGLPPTEDINALTQSNWLISLLNFLIVASGSSLFVITLFSGKIKYGKYHGLLLICVIVLLSTLWSVAPDLTIRRSLTFVGSMLLIIYFVEELGSDRLFRCIVQELVIIGVISVIMRVVWKQYSVMPGTHALQGIYGQKNVFGAAMSVGILGAIYLYLRDIVKQRYYLWIAVFFLFCDALSTSGSTIVQGIIFFYIFSLYLLATRIRFGWIVGCLPLLGAALWAAISPDTLFGLLGKDTTLTGRTDLWPYVVEVIQERPWLGWGYRSFWQVDNLRAVELWYKVLWIVPEAHNGLLGVLVDVGYIGCGAFVYVFLASGITAAQNLKAGNSAIGITAIMSFVGFLFYGVTEEIFLNPGIWSIMFYAIVVAGIHEYRQYRMSSRYGLSPHHRLFGSVGGRSTELSCRDVRRSSERSSRIN